jgi:hypothetical protein
MCPAHSLHRILFARLQKGVENSGLPIQIWGDAENVLCHEERPGDCQSSLRNPTTPLTERTSQTQGVSLEYNK